MLYDYYFGERKEKKSGNIEVNRKPPISYVVERWHWTF
jgi:hypothetical protein